MVNTPLYVCVFLIVGLPVGRKKIIKIKNSVDIIGESFTQAFGLELNFEELKECGWKERKEIFQQIILAGGLP